MSAVTCTLTRRPVYVRAAHEHGLRCHIGRVGTRKRVSWAKDAEADSIDSCLPLWSKQKAAAFFDGLRQGQLFRGVA